jgi:hypothetical protein
MYGSYCKLRLFRCIQFLVILVMMKCGGLFEVRTEFLNTMQTSFGFKQLSNFSTVKYSDGR